MDRPTPEPQDTGYETLEQARERIKTKLDLSTFGDRVADMLMDAVNDAKPENYKDRIEMTMILNAQLLAIALGLGAGILARKEPTDHQARSFINNYVQTLRNMEPMIPPKEKS